MITIKEKKASHFKVNKTALIASEIVVLLVIVFLICFVLKGSGFLKAQDGDKKPAKNTTENTIVYKEGLTFAPTNKNEENDEEESKAVTQNSGGEVNNVKPDIQVNDSKPLADPSGWSKADIISKAKDAVNKTKAYTGNLTVNHSESFTAEVTECSAGGIVRSVVDLMIGWVVKPVEETLVYQNGRAVNSEGETVPIILPKKNGFTLTEGGVKTASVQRSGNEYVIKMNLVEENVGMYDVPEHNAASIGYLDVANFDLSFMEVDSAYIVYKGSSIELRINADGYVTYAKYNIPLHIEGSAHKGSISGSATFEGGQAEEWRLDW